MKTLVVGGGLIGLTTAYELARRGDAVVLVDRNPGPGEGASFANGALLTPSMSEPWNMPGSWKTLLKSLGAKDSPMQLRLGAIPSLASWGMTFLKNSQPRRFERNTDANLKLGLYSL